MTFRIQPLPRETFAPWFALTAAELAARRARIVIADSQPGFPCRVSLEDAGVGEPVLLAHYCHHPVSSPYRASFAIYVRRDAPTARPEPGEIPAALADRPLLAVRGYDASGALREAAVCPGDDLAGTLVSVMRGEAVDYTHIHNAIAGCYLARSVVDS